MVTLPSEIRLDSDDAMELCIYGKAGLWPLQSRRPAFGSRQGCGWSPWCGNTAFRVAMIDRSTWSDGS